MLRVACGRIKPPQRTLVLGRVPDCPIWRRRYVVRACTSGYGKAFDPNLLSDRWDRKRQDGHNHGENDNPHRSLLN
jgi:hypothetical protein